MLAHRVEMACMRALSTAAVFFSVIALAACSSDEETSASSSPTLIPPNTTTGGTAAGNTSGTGAGTGSGTGTASDTPTVDAELDEVVYVIFDIPNGYGFCTGTLVSKDVVVTAGHCLRTDEGFTNFQVVAPRAKGSPRVTASKTARVDGDYDDPGTGDFGFLQLDEPIALSAYAQMTDVSARVASGEKIQGVAVVRTAEEVEAPLSTSPIFTVSDDVDNGYEHGFSTTMFSHGGDSGAGLFLIENGKRTHKLIAVARQPEPDRNLDHFTRLDSTMRQWFDSNVNE